MQVVYVDKKPVVRLTATEKKAIAKACDILSMLKQFEPYKERSQAALDALAAATKTE